MNASAESNPPGVATPQRLPLSVIIPTNNESARIPAFLTSLDRWLDLAHDVAVVDQYSADGTIELLRSGLYHRCAEFYQQSFGLYSAINFGVSQLQSDFIYVARPGSVITRDGIVHLVETAQRLNCDVLFSPPHAESATGDGTEAAPASARSRWPIEQILAAQPPAGPALLRRTGAYYVALANALGARFQSMLGPISGVLFRTATLRARPFDEANGQASDALWALQHGLDITFGATPKACATFQPDTDELSKRELAELKRVRAQVPALASEAMSAALKETGARDREDLAGLERYFDATQALLEAQSRWRRYRQQDILWFVRPAAWRARSAVARHRKTSREAVAWMQKRPLWCR